MRLVSKLFAILLGALSVTGQPIPGAVENPSVHLLKEFSDDVLNGYRLNFDLALTNRSNQVLKIPSRSGYVVRLERQLKEEAQAASWETILQASWYDTEKNSFPECARLKTDDRGRVSGLTTGLFLPKTLTKEIVVRGNLRLRATVELGCRDSSESKPIITTVKSAPFDIVLTQISEQ